MERNREARRVGIAAANGLASRRRHRSGSLRDSPEDDGAADLQETARLRDRGTGKKDRDREREQERDRDRERERDRDRDRMMSSRNKRRRGERMMHGNSNRDDGMLNDDTSEESVNDDEDDDEDDPPASLPSSMRMLPPINNNISSSNNNSSSLSNHHHHHRKSYPPPPKLFRSSAPVNTSSTATTTPPWKAHDEMIGVSVPRKARSASTKRSHEWASSCGVGGNSEQIHRQASTSPVRSSGPTAMLASASASPAPVSSPPSSSNISVKKKMKSNGPKQRPPKSSPKLNNANNSSNQDEIEIEIAEVLYGLMRQPQGPSKQESANDSMKFDSKDLSSYNKHASDAKSRVSSPISYSPSTLPPLQSSSSIPPSNSSSSAAPLSAIAPKRKRPRPVKYEEDNPTAVFRNNSISSAVKGDVEQSTKIETYSPSLGKNSGSVATENGGVSHDKMAKQAAVPASTEKQQSVVKSENKLSSDLKKHQESDNRKDSAVNKEEPKSPKKESPAVSGLRLDGDPERVTISKTNSTVSAVESLREEKFHIDLMAPPPSRSSPERDSEIDFVAVDPKPVVTDVEMERKQPVKEDDKAVKFGKEVNVEPEEKKARLAAEEFDSLRPSIKERNFDLQFDLEKSDIGTVSRGVNKVNHNVHRQPNTEKAAQSNSLPMPMSMGSWPGGLPHMGYMAPLQGVVSMDGSSVSPAALQPPQYLFNQSRLKRCATHCYIARNILYHQQISRINPFWPAAAAGSTLQFGSKPCNVNVVPPTDLHAARGVNSVQDKAQGMAIFPGHSLKDKNSPAANIVDPAQRKQILLQQPLTPGAPSNILHGPAFIFPLNQQQAAAAAAASVRPGTVKSPPLPSSAASTSTSSSASMNATGTAVAGATAMSFNYPNMAGNETQYLAILQNSPYPIPIPAHVGAAQPYRGTPQAMPFFNGSFYSSQMIHPSQLQPQQPPNSHPQQGQQSHQNPSISSGSSSSQKHLQNQQQRPHGSGINGGSGNMQGFPNTKNQPSQTLQFQQRQQMHNQNVAHQPRQLETELGEDSPSSSDNRISRANMNIYGQNFAMPIHAPNFALMTPPTMSGTAGSSGNPGEKKQQQPQPQGSKAGVEPSQAYAMSFASINGATVPNLDISSIAQHPALQSLPEAARHHFMAVAQAAQQKKNYRISEEVKTGGNDGANADDDRKSMSGGKMQSISGQSIAFSRPDLTDPSVLTMPGNTVIDSSARTFNIGSTPARATGSVMPTSITSANALSVQQQVQRNQHQHQHQQQMMQLQKQNQYAAAAAASARSKTPVTSNGYQDHIPSSSSMVAKFPNALQGFPSNLVQASNSPAQSPQWKSSVRTTTSQVSSPSLAPTSTSIKTLPQQPGRVQQGHAQISFAANPKPSSISQGQATPNGNQSPSPPIAVGSPTTSSMSKSGAGGSPRTTSNSTSNKGGQSTNLSSQQSKNSPSIPSQKSSPVGGRNIPSILGHAHNSTSSSSSVSKSQMPQPQQQQLPKHALQQAQMLYNSNYMTHVQHGTGSTPASGFYLQRHRAEQQPQAQGSSVATSAGVLLCPPVSLANATTSDPAKAVAAAAAAASNMKGGGLSSQGLVHAQFAAASPGKAHIVPGSYPYVHAVPTAVQVKPAEKKQPAAD